MEEYRNLVHSDGKDTNDIVKLSFNGDYVGIVPLDKLKKLVQIYLNSRRPLDICFEDNNQPFLTLINIKELGIKISKKKRIKILFDMLCNSIPYHPDVTDVYRFSFFIDDEHSYLGIYSANLFLSNAEAKTTYSLFVEKLEDALSIDVDIGANVWINSTKNRPMIGMYYRWGDNKIVTRLIKVSAYMQYNDNGPLVTFEEDSYDCIPRHDNHELLEDLNMDLTETDEVSLFYIPGYVKYERNTHSDFPNAHDFFKYCKYSTEGSIEINALLDSLKTDRFDLESHIGIQSAPYIISSIAVMLKGDINLAISQFYNKAVKKLIKQPVKNDYYKLMENYRNKHMYTSFRTILYYAKIDNESKYTNILGAAIWEKLISATIKTISPLAEAMALALQPFYVVKTDTGKATTKTILYKFKGHSYTAYGTPEVHISYLFRRDQYLYQVIDACISTLHAKASTSSSEKRKFYHIALSNVTEIEKKTDDEKFIKKLVTEILNKMAHLQIKYEYDDKIDMDYNPNLFAVANGVLEAITVNNKDTVIFRSGMPDDRIVKVCPNYYSPSLRNSEKYQYVKEYFRRNFPDPETRAWFMSFVAGSIKGKNPKLAVFLLGHSDAGKSALVHALNGALGKDNAFTSKSELLNDPKLTQSGAHPEIIAVMNGRFISFEETKSEINAPTFKNVNGGDAESHQRDLYDKGGSMSNKSRFLYVCNAFPGFTAYDNAVVKRTAIVRTPVRYVSKNSKLLPSTTEEQCKQHIYPEDPDFTTHVQKYYDHILLYIMDHYGKWIDTNGNENGLRDLPAEVQRITREEFNKKNGILKFKNNYMYESPGQRLYIEDAHKAIRKCKLLHGNVTLDSFKSKAEDMFFLESRPDKEGRPYWKGYAVAGINIYCNYNIATYLIDNYRYSPGKTVTIKAMYKSYKNDSITYEDFEEFIIAFYGDRAYEGIVEDMCAV